MKEKPREGETPQEKFKRLATHRTNTILKYLRVLGNCSNQNQYKYTQEDVGKIFSEIENYTREVKAKFQNHKQRKDFKL